MAYYKNKHELRNGRIMLYQISDSINGIWQMRLNVLGLKNKDGKSKYIVESTKAKTYTNAVRIAEDEYDRIVLRLKNNELIRDWTFTEHWQNWYHRQCATGSWKKEHEDWHTGRNKLYFEPYFGSEVLNDLTFQYISGYWAWRITRWQTGVGAAIKASNASSIPAEKSLKMEMSALKKIFRDAHNNRRINYLPDVKINISLAKEKRRASFDDKEWNKLSRNLDSYANKEVVPLCWTGLRRC
ncbi:MAG: hypothetical protein JKY45_11000 [Emcibacter sp.]|nr:hypothetical protein [Emcibacter sp.]